MRCLGVLGLVLLATTVPAQQIKINEFDCGTPDFVELMNRELTPVNVGGWQVQTWYRTGATGTLTTDGTYTIPAGTTLAPGARLVLQDQGVAGQPGTLGSCSIQTGFNYNWNTGYSVEIVLRTNAAVAIDYVTRNPFAATPQTPNLPAGQVWTGTLATTGNNVSRNGNNDTNAASDWTVSASGTACNLNPNQSVPPPADLNITNSGPGVGDVIWSLTTIPPIAGAEFYGLYSFTNTNPTGSGAFFGVAFDAIVWLYQPLVPNSPFHSNLDAGGQLGITLPPGTLPPGFFVEGVAVVINGASLIVSDVVEVTF